MTKKQKAKAIRELSPRAFALWCRVANSARWYPLHDPHMPKVMQELWDAGLVTSMGRVALIKACIVPVGAKPFEIEKYPAHE